jgi:hypothetical protein
MSQQRFHDPGASLPSPGSSRALVPPFRRYYRGTATSCRPSRRASLPSLGGATGTRGGLLPSPPRVPAPGLGLVTRYPRPRWLPWRRQDLPSSWGTPIPVCTCSFDPGRPVRPWHGGTYRVAPAKGTTKAPTTQNFRGSIAWLSGWRPTYHDAGYPSPRKARFQVLRSSSPGQAFTHRAPAKGFQLTSCSSSSFPKLLGTIPFISSFLGPYGSCRN